MGTSTRLTDLFASLAALDTPEARRLYFEGHPILASQPSVDLLTAWLAGEPASIAPARARQALDELRAFLDEVAPGPESYPMGGGPVEIIWKQVLSGALREDRGLALAAEPETADLLSALYARTVGFYCASRASQGHWERASLLHRLLLQSARACRNEQARVVRIRAEREWLVTASAVLMRVADGRVYRDACAAGEWLLSTLDTRGERALLAETLHYLGVLHLDPYTAFRSVANYDLEHRTWLSQTAERLGSDAIEGIPTPRDALALAEGYFRRAAEAAVGDYRAYVLKALVQAVDWRRSIGDGENADTAVAAQALASIDPMRDPARWLQVALALQRAGEPIDETKLAALLAVPLHTWSERLGPHLTAAMLTPMLLLFGERDPEAGLALAAQAADLVADLPQEEERMQLLERELALFSAFARARLRVDLSDREAARTALSAAAGDPEATAAGLLALALRAPMTDDEAVGLELVDQAEALAPELAARHSRALSYLRSLLWLGLGSNAAKADPPRNAEAVLAYARALDEYLAQRLLGRASELWLRLQHLAGRRDPLSADAFMRVLRVLALPSELALGEPAAAAVRGICRQLTIMLARDRAHDLPLAWQVAKGQRWAATLRNGAAAPARDEHAQELLRKIAQARGELGGAGANEQQHTSGSPLFEAWLTSYVRTELYDGDQAWERLANLKMTFDGHVSRLLAPVAPAERAAHLSLDEIRGRVGPRSALLITYVGEHEDGRLATYGVLLAGQNLTAHARVPAFQGNEFEMTEGERSTVLSAVGAEVGALRHALTDEPDAGAVASARASEALSGSLALFFGALAGDLAALSAAGVDHLIVVPHDALHFAPFHLFALEGEPLASRFTVSYLPNLALLGRAQTRVREPAPPRVASIGLGFTGGAGGFVPIEEAAAEARQVAAMFGVPAIVDADATKPAVLQALAAATHVHIATHGMLDVDAPAFQMLALHPPEDESGRLHAHELLDLDLRSIQLVTLSACETALGRVDRSDNLRGLPAALFSAGVETVVGTLWEVESHASQLFFTTLYGELRAGASRLAAFRDAQQVTRARFPDYRDWGPFYLAGAWT